MYYRDKVKSNGLRYYGSNSGFYIPLYNLKFIETGSYKKIIIVGTDKISSIVDYPDRTTCIIFGDGKGSTMEPKRRI